MAIVPVPYGLPLSLAPTHNGEWAGLGSASCCARFGALYLPVALSRRKSTLEIGTRNLSGRGTRPLGVPLFAL